MALAIPEYQYGDVDRYLKQRRAARGFVTPREERAAWQGYWDTQIGQQLESRRLGLMQQQLGLGQKRLDWREQEMKNEEDARKMQGYFEGLGTLFQGIFVAGYGREKGWW